MCVLSGDEPPSTGGESVDASSTFTALVAACRTSPCPGHATCLVTHLARHAASATLEPIPSSSVPLLCAAVAAVAAPAHSHAAVRAATALSNAARASLSAASAAMRDGGGGLEAALALAVTASQRPPRCPGAASVYADVALTLQAFLGAVPTAAAALASSPSHHSRVRRAVVASSLAIAAVPTSPACRTGGAAAFPPALPPHKLGQALLAAASVLRMASPFAGDDERAVTQSARALLALSEAAAAMLAMGQAATSPPGQRGRGVGHPSVKAAAVAAAVAAVTTLSEGMGVAAVEAAVVAHANVDVLAELADGREPSLAAAVSDLLARLA